MTNSLYIQISPDKFRVHVPIAIHYDGDSKYTQFRTKDFPIKDDSERQEQYLKAMMYRNAICDMLGIDVEKKSTKLSFLRFNRPSVLTNQELGVGIMDDIRAVKGNLRRKIVATTTFREYRYCNSFNYHVQTKRLHGRCVRRTRAEAIRLAKRAKREQLLKVISLPEFNALFD